MKKFFAVCMAVIGFTFSTSTVAKAEEQKPRFYPKTTVVKETRTETDEVICVDFNGFEWAFKGIDEWMVGDYCSMIMYDNCTDIIFDDVIISCHYDGWLNGSFGFTPNRETVIEMR